MNEEQVAALRAEVERLRVLLAKTHERVEFAGSLVESQCPTGKHGSWFCECEYVHTCGWCEREAAEARLEAVQADVKRYAESLLSMRCSKYRDVGDWAWLNAEGIGAKLAALASPPEPEADEVPRDRYRAERDEDGSLRATPAPVDQPVPPTEPGEQATHNCVPAGCSDCRPGPVPAAPEEGK